MYAGTLESVPAFFGEGFVIESWNLLKPAHFRAHRLIEENDELTCGRFFLTVIDDTRSPLKGFPCVPSLIHTDGK